MMIICGYPGIGKTSMAGTIMPIGMGEVRVIDLDSSLFAGRAHIYANVAASLARQGCIVLVSTYKELRDCLSEIKDIPIVACYPSLDLQEQWTKKLSDRYRESYFPDESEKNHRTYMRAVDHYKEDIESIKYSGFINIELCNMDYRLDSEIVMAYDKLKEEEEC